MGYNPSADIVRIAAAVEKAPSVFNTRPWTFRFPGTDRIELRLPANLDGIDPAHAREYTISCGAALLNLRLAIRVAGHDLAVWLMPDPYHDRALLASVEIMTRRIKRPTFDEQELYEAIWQRHTNRSPYIRPVPLPLIVAMEQAAAKEGGWLRLLHPRQARKWMRLAAEVDHDPDFRPPFPNYVSAANYGPHPTNRYPPTRHDFWRDDETQHFRRRPQLMALSTDDDKPLDWLRAGQALQRAILTGTRYSVSAPYGLTAQHHAPARYGVPARHHLLTGHDELAYYGLSVSFLTQPLERDDVRAEPRHWPWRWRFPELPEMVLRVGYAADEPPPAQRLRPDIRDAWPQLPEQPSQRTVLVPDSEPGT